MKITGIRTIVVNAIHRNWIFVKVETDQPGLHGWGEATLEWKTRAVLGTLEDLEPFLLGEDPRRIEHVFAKLTKVSFWPLGAIGLSAVSAIDQALWDIKAKDLGVPVWQLLGGRVRDRVRVYTHLRRARIGAQVATDDIPAFCDAVEETVAMGYSAVKLGFVPYCAHEAPLPDLLHVEKLAVAVRERVGPDIAIMTDFHGRPASPDVAKAFIDVIAPIRPLFVEEPIQPGDARAMAQLARRVDCPIATGERLFTPGEFAELARHGGVAHVQPDLSHCGGLTGGRRIAAIAEAGHMGIAPHNPMGPVAGAVALHFDVATPNFVIQEEAVGLVPWFDEIFTHPLALEDGCWAVPEGPGYGLEIDEAAAARHPFEPEIVPALDAVLPDGTIANW
ncbi:enolase C-terminal domain-like protein [Palleronia sp. LCG004]|uniref:enolase C-terminal domain-like protein n=1 Tax=Palleronia sp. LCG004 TaxID=3079304 RepID=UPI002941C7C3|nr:enolase C-terminal domain-like protein [Palleronia sp. LCG004]WOI58161.1 enolase C-terminal domain-like protein [Palleronia sp. LCG004]